MEAREIRRLAGLLHARLPELRLSAVPDPRQPQWCHWKLPALLRLGVAGVMAGGRSLADLEQLSAEMSPSARGLLGLTRRVPDTTLRDAYVKVDPTHLRDGLERQCLAALRRKALAPDRLPFGMVAMDGKATAGDGWDHHYAQKQTHSSDGGASGVVRTITCCLVSAVARPCLDAVPIPAATNEMGHFATAFTELWARYGHTGLFKLISYDAGGASLDNATLVRGKGVHYLFGLRGTQPTLRAEAERLLGGLPSGRRSPKPSMRPAPGPKPATSSSPRRWPAISTGCTSRRWCGCIASSVIVRAASSSKRPTSRTGTTSAACRAAASPTTPGCTSSASTGASRMAVTTPGTNSCVRTSIPGLKLIRRGCWW
jgi:hypothetical protein